MSTAEKAIVLPPIDQVGIIVADLDKAIKFYSSRFGWGPFKVINANLEGCMYRGKPADCKLKIAFGRSGPIEIELFQVIEGPSPHADFLREKGEGIQHVRFSVDNLDEILAEWAKDGIEPVWERRSPVASTAYVDTQKAGGGIMVELIQFHPTDKTEAR
ncbi:MAG: VOC family protein [Dehalococcoidia bacterium]